MFKLIASLILATIVFVVVVVLSATAVLPVWTLIVASVVLLLIVGLTVRKIVL